MTHTTDPHTPTPDAAALVEQPARDVLAVDGRGDPEGPEFGAAVRALFAARAALGAVEDVPLEGSYWQEGEPHRFDLEDRDNWQWRLLVPAPPRTTPDTAAEAGKRFGAPVHLWLAPARTVAQLLHLGAYADEGPSLEALYGFATGQGLVPAGPHTEVYLTDPFTTPPAELRTLLQVPVVAGEKQG